MDIINAVFTLGIPGLVIGTMAYRKLFPKENVTQRFEEVISPQGITQDTLLNTRQWMDYINNNPDQVPHLAVIGGTGAGKTTFATAVLHERRGQMVVITAKEGDHWGGLSYVGIDEDATYTTANAMFAALDREVKRRLVAVKNRTMTADWLTVVLDDYSTLRKVCDAADEPFKLIARLGRSLRVRLILVSDSDQVKAWGIEGEGATRQHFAFVKLQRGHKGTLEIDGADVSIDTSLVYQLAQHANLGSRGWIIPRDPNSELQGLLGISTGDDFSTPRTSTNQFYEPVRQVLADTDAVSDDRLMVELVRRGVSANKIHEMLGGTRSVVLDKVRLLKESNSMS